VALRKNHLAEICSLNKRLLVSLCFLNHTISITNYDSIKELRSLLVAVKTVERTKQQTWWLVWGFCWGSRLYCTLVQALQPWNIHVQLLHRHSVHMTHQWIDCLQECRTIIGGGIHTAAAAVAGPLRMLGQQPIKNAAPTRTMFVIFVICWSFLLKSDNVHVYYIKFSSSPKHMYNLGNCLLIFASISGQMAPLYCLNCTNFISWFSGN